jgi:hypothetical protein
MPMNLLENVIGLTAIRVVLMANSPKPHDETMEKDVSTLFEVMLENVTNSWIRIM